MFKGIEVKRFFTGGAETMDDVVNSVHWKTHANVTINDDAGKSVFHREGVEAPAFWSDQAVRIVASKFFHDEIRVDAPTTVGNGSVTKTIPAENSIRQIISRVVNTIAEKGLLGGYFGDLNYHALNESSPPEIYRRRRRDAFKAELTYILLHQKATFNSPVWFNIGVPGRRPRSSACFINDVEDDLGAILDAVKNEATIFKYGGGSGINMSKLRASTERLNGTGSYSSGPVSFMQAFDAFAGVIKSGSIARRAAKMAVMNVDHPDILEFINSKVKGERIAQALIAAGFPAAFNDPDSAYRWAPFQNANHSVRVTDDFMRKATGVANLGKDDPPYGSTWTTHRITDGTPAWTMPASKILRKMAEAAWACGDPGVQFHDAVNRWNLVIDTHVINGSNPCSEYMFIDDSACNLASLNLVAFEGPDGSMEIEAIRHTVDVMLLAMEILVGFSSYPNAKIERNSHDYRPLGLGYANLGALLMRQGLAYDSDKGRSLAAALTALILGRSYRRSAEMARDCGGPFAKWDTVKSGFMHVIGKHSAAMRQIRCNPDTLTNRIRMAACEDMDIAETQGESHGFRNGQVVVIAPTGTIGFMMDVDTTGIEPALALVSTKKLVGGGTELIVNKSVAMALKRLGYDETTFEDRMKHDHLNVIQEHRAIFATALGANAIPWEAHIKMLAAVQPFVSGSISKTINMPADATVEDIEKAYIMAWQHDLKCLAVYRDGCKQSQPVTLVDAMKKTEEATAWDGKGAYPPELFKKQWEEAFGTDAQPSTAREPDKLTGSNVDRVSVSYAVLLKALATHNSHPKEQPCTWGIDCPQITPPFEGAALAAPLPPVSFNERTSSHAEIRLTDLLKLVEQACATCGKELKTTRPLVVGLKTTTDTAVHHLGCFQPGHPARRKLPREVPSTRVKYNIGGHKGYFHVGYWPDGSGVAEIWFESNKEGSFVSGLLSALGVFMSLCLQYGVPLEKIVEKLEHTSFPPSGFTGEGPPIPSASSILDYLAKWLAFRYLGRGEQATGYQNGVPSAVAPSELVEQKLVPGTEIGVTLKSPQHWRELYEQQLANGPPCAICHTPMERSGTCHRCPNCGNTSGCS